MEATGHETEDRLELYALGRLSEWDGAQIEEHLFLCVVCRDKLDNAADFALAIRGELKERPLPAKKKLFEWLSWPVPRFAIAGAFGIALLALALIWIRPSLRVAPLATLQLTAMRGEMQTITLTREVDLIVAAPARGAPFRLEVVDDSGSSIWTGAPEGIPEGLRIKVKDRLSQGDYFVRLYASGGELLHEYGFRVRD